RPARDRCVGKPLQDSPTARILGRTHFGPYHPHLGKLTPIRKESLSMNDTNIRVAVIGCGYWGKNHVRNMSKLGALAAVCDVTESGRKLAGEFVHDVPVLGRSV